MLWRADLSWIRSAKGDLISEVFFLVIKYFKKPAIFLQISALAFKKWLKK